MKKGLGVFAVLALLIIAVFFFVLPEKAQAASIGDLTFELNSTRDGYIVSECKTTASGSLTIPATYNGLPVTRIGDYAFYGCTSLTSITIPDSVTFIGESAFDSCTGLTKITIPDSVTYIDEGAFLDCTALTSVTIGKQVTRIDNGAFARCTSLTSITIPDSVTYIDNSAFSTCTSLREVFIGKGLAGMGENVFKSCSNLTHLQVAAGNTTYHSAGNCIIDTNWKALIVGCQNSIIPSDGSVTRIADNAFYERNILTSITIPSSVTSIGDSAFFRCAGLTSITIPGSVTSIGDSAFSHCSDLTSVIMGDGVDSIGNYAFYYCTNLASVTIPNSVTSIGTTAFAVCKSLKSFTVPSSLAWVGVGAFTGCNSLKDVYITDPGAWCKISFGDNVLSSLMDYADCLHIVDSYGTEVKALVFDKTITSIPSSRFMFFKNITSITLSDNVTSIGASAFWGCTSLTSITIPDSVNTIGTAAFEKCNNLSSVIYCGIQEQWDAIAKGTHNESLTNAALQLHNYANRVCTICGKTECEALGHDWTDADCETPKTCNRCQVTEGEALGHDMRETPAVAPTCETAGKADGLVCANGCGKTEGGETIPAVGHEAGAAATCETAQTCIRCDYVFVAAQGHNWVEANCAMPKTCKTCHLTEGEISDHRYENGICSGCQHYGIFISLSNSTLYRGDTITVTVSSYAIEHCIAGGFLFNYDTSIFEYVGGKALVSGFTGAGVSTANGRVAGYFMGGDETVQGDIFQITLKVKDTAAFGSVIISGEPSLVAADGTVPCNVEDATVTIACSHSYGDWIAIDETWHKHICTICSYEETAYVEYTVTFQYADGTVISSAQYHYGDTVAEPQDPPAQDADYVFVGWDKEIESCTGSTTYTAVFKKFLAGDIDGNDVVDHNDAIYLLLNTMFGEEFYPLNAAPADIDGNGTVDQDDAVYLLLHTLFGEAFYPLQTK